MYKKNPIMQQKKAAFLMYKENPLCTDDTYGIHRLVQLPQTQITLMA
jgi:hypothetical protein